ILPQRGDQSRVDFLVDVKERLPVHGIYPVIAGGAQTKTLPRHVMARQLRQVSVVHAYVTIGIEHQFAALLPGDPIPRQSRMPDYGSSILTAQHFQFAPQSPYF